MSVLKEMEKTKYWWKYHSEQRQEQTQHTYGTAPVIQKKETLNPLWKNKSIHATKVSKSRSLWTKTTPQIYAYTKHFTKESKNNPSTPMRNVANLRTFSFSVLVF